VAVSNTVVILASAAPFVREFVVTQYRSPDVFLPELGWLVKIVNVCLSPFLIWSDLEYGL
jgi:hypothetical protein